VSADRLAQKSPGTLYAGFVTRTIAFALDAALINLVALATAGVVALVLSVLPESDRLTSIVAVAGSVLFFAWVTGYFAVSWTTTGETPGSRVMWIRVARVDGGPLRPRHAALRLAGIVLSLPLLVGFVPILLTERRRGLPDFMAGTVVLATVPHGAGRAR
jgi:uncharacterized RDD family membrane protein YckC